VPTNTYELVVLGDDLASLVCATLCARRGMRTLVLGEERPARYSLGPHKLPIEPVMWPVQPGSPGERVLKELHAELALRRKLREPRIAAQVVAPDMRIDLGGDRLVAELQRELGTGADAWLAAWKQGGEIARQADPLVASEHAFPPVGFFERREVTRIAETAGAAAETWWKAAAALPQARLWHHLAAVALRHPDPPPVAIARALDAWQAGPPALRGDGDAIRELLVEKLTTAGGEVRAGKVTDASVSWGKISSVTLASGDEIGAGQIVASMPPRELAALLGKKAPKRLAELADSIELVGYRYTLNIVIDEAGIPEHMAPTVAVIAARDGEPVGDGAFSIHLGESDDSGRVVATIATIVAADAPLDKDKLAARCTALRVALWRRLADVMPFFEKHLVLAHSPYEATPPQVPGSRGSYDVPRQLPLALPPIYKGQMPATAELGALPYLGGLKNLTLTGDMMLPSMGVEGALVAGWSAAKVACALGGKKKDYLRDEVVGAAS
jgi:phytoene dehydrogenase-like protein